MARKHTYRKATPSPPHWYWSDSDYCWNCKNRTNCSNCNRLKQFSRTQKGKKPLQKEEK